MDTRNSRSHLARDYSTQRLLRSILIGFFQITLIFLFTNSLQAAALFDPSRAEISVDEARRLGATLTDKVMYLGDMILYRTEVDKFAIGGELWPDGRLVYEFSPDLDNSEKQAFRDACHAWTLRSSSIICHERTTEADYVYVVEHEGHGCGGTVANPVQSSCSSLGKKGGGGRQDLMIHESHWTNSPVLKHEIGHAFGLINEQSRADRNAFVRIMSENIQPGQEKNFEIVPSSSMTEYDVVSIMHSHNCVYSKHEDCYQTTKNYHTLMPIACHIDTLGGEMITALDYDSIRRVYAPAIYSLFPQQRKRKCGIHDYSLKQMDETCGPNCETIGGPKHERVETVSTSWCGPTPDVPCQSYCPEDKTCFDHGWDNDYFSCGIGTMRVELEVKCGCTHNLVLAQCADTAGAISLSKLQDLLDSKNPKDKKTGRFVSRILSYQLGGNLNSRLYVKIGNFLFDNYNHHGYSESIKTLTFLMRAFMAGRLYTDPTYKLSLPAFRNLANQSGLRTNSL